MPHYRVHHDPRSSHQQISTLVRELRRSGRLTPAESRAAPPPVGVATHSSETVVGPVLDVGCAQGIIGHLIQDLGLTVDGVEANAEWAQLARESGAYRDVWANLVEDAPLPPKTYRLIICGDVLEHTPNPVSVLKKLRAAATDDASFIVSVPNVAHLAIRLMLLVGKFPKMDRGILDRTHLRFFTRRTLVAFLRGAGLAVDELRVTPVPLPLVVPARWHGAWLDGLHACSARAARLWPGGLAYQFVAVCRLAGGG